MSKIFCYCIGGSAARIAEAAAHLCAMNRVSREDITFIIVDKDTECGGTRKALRTIENVSALSTGYTRSDDVQRAFCSSTLHVDNWRFSDALRDIIDGDDGNVSLKNAVCRIGSMDTVLLDAFYSAHDQNEDTKGGFYGNPALGSTIFKFMLLMGSWRDNNLANADISYPVKYYITNHPGESVKVFVIGSIFGGTGAAIFSNLAKHIRNSIPSKDRANLHIAGLLLLPYFKFVTTEGDGCRVDPNEFWTKAKVALEQYDRDVDLIRSHTNPDAVFERLYVLGQNPLHITANSAQDSGVLQANHFDLIDVLGGEALVDFVNAEPNSETGDYCIKDPHATNLYEYKYIHSNTPIATLDFSHLGNLRESMCTMLSFVNFVVTRIKVQLENPTTKTSAIRMIRSIYPNSTLKTVFGKEKDVCTQIRDDAKATIAPVYEYAKSYIALIEDLANNGKDWSRQNNQDYSSHYNLFSTTFIESLKALTAAIDNNANGFAADADSRLKDTNFLKSGDYDGIKCLEIEDKHLNSYFEDRSKRYPDTLDTKTRICDYLHEAYQYCATNTN